MQSVDLTSGLLGYSMKASFYQHQPSSPSQSLVIKWGNPLSSTKCFRTIDLPSLLLSHGLVQSLLPSLFLSLRVVFASSPAAAAHSSSTTWLFSAPRFACVRACVHVHVYLRAHAHTNAWLAGWLADWLPGWFGKYLVTINEERVHVGCTPPPSVELRRRP